MFALVYVSSATKPFSPDELSELLAKARVGNAALGITGMLLYSNGNFMQVLEGEEPVVQALRQKIARDPRHHGMLVLLTEQQATREFSQWSMAFKELSKDEVRKAEGFDEFMNLYGSGHTVPDNPSKLRRLLRTFRQSMT